MRNKQGNEGEAKAVLHFLKEGYEVYTSFGTACSCDVLLLKDNKTYRVSVKSTSRKISNSSWEVNMRQSRYDGQVKFDKTSCDLVAVYIAPEDRLVVFNSEDLTSGRSLTIKIRVA